ncbi:methionyl-tRNA formyltransferase [Candidatus Aerophobetes bacterium]|uniref:Methionyl-tRNA formyltransferase n=1 Tax=Aerophobetes bacterium TaxID=2030807 RepID=A0A2A4X738_UNCAE|nr:MAG: methionyl-tRNA formyltransferase [Candidatus Aerophobetes bacterium]
MKIVFFGNTEFSKHILISLVSQGFDLVGVVANPDKARHRSSKLQPSCVKQWVLDQGLDVPIFQPEKLGVGDFKEKVKSLGADVFVVVAYGKILPQSVLDIPLLDCINVHASLLPQYRGASPIEAALIHGDGETGVSIMRMVKAMDAGPVFAMKRVEIKPRMDKEALVTCLKEAGSTALVEVLGQIEAKTIFPKEQDETSATYVKKIVPEDLKICWKENAQTIFNKVRAYAPKPGAWMEVDFSGEVKRVKILACEVLEAEGLPGKNVVFSKHAWVIGTGEGSIGVLKLQVQGKKALDIKVFLLGCQREIITL